MTSSDGPPLRWNGWGVEGRTFDFHGRAEALFQFLQGVLGADVTPAPAPTLDATSLPPLRLRETDRAALVERLAPARVVDDRRSRATHALGQSYRDLLRLRSGALPVAPDLVLYPETHEEVLSVLAWAADAHVAVVPYGGGSSVVGGVEALAGDHRACVTLDLTRMDRLLRLDSFSRTATFQAGVFGPALEAALSRRGHTLGHYPQSFEHSTLGGWIAARGAGQQSNRYGTMAELLAGARLATPTGTWEVAAHPASAAGPDLRAVVAGSEGALGVITEATVHVRPVPEKRRFLTCLFRDLTAGVDAVRRLIQAELPLASLRLSDAEETFFFGALRRTLSGKADRIGPILERVGFDRPLVLLVVLEGDGPTVDATFRRTLRVAVRAGALPVGPGPGERWYAGRFDTPYLRDPLLDRGFGVDTLETATTWSKLRALHRSVGDAIRGAFRARGERALVLAHVSHGYRDGASLYFTMVFPRDLADPVGQWQAMKNAASDAIHAGGGTISHHHGVGLDHRPWMEGEKSRPGLALLEGAKAALDPKGVLNPGKLL